VKYKKKKKKKKKKRGESKTKTKQMKNDKAGIAHNKRGGGRKKVNSITGAK
jgi:hypothetical protein